MKTYTLTLTETELNLLKYTVAKAHTVCAGQLAKNLDSLREKIVTAPTNKQPRQAFDPEYGDF